MHLDEEQIQRALHGELGGGAAQAVQRHLADCASCRARLEEARREERHIHTLLGRLDHAAPSVKVEALVARARQGRRAAAWRWAAGIVLALAAAGAAYAAPGSPVRRWVVGIARVFSPPDPAATDGAPGASGIAVQPGARFTIEFKDSSGQATVWLTDRSEVVIRSLDSAATFTTDVDRLIVEDVRGTASDYEVELPSGAPWVEVRVGERRLLLKEGPSVAANVEPDERGRYILPLTP